MCSNGVMTRQFNFGLLAVDGASGAQGDRFLEAKRFLESELRAKYSHASREALKELDEMRPYVSYYKAFGYTYHVLLQLESVAKGKAIPGALPPVAAMFMAELKNGILTAGHDLDAVCFSVRSMVSDGTEGYTTLDSKAVTCVAGDFLIADQAGILSSMLRGPDRRTAISRETKRFLYTAYAPDGLPD